MATRRSFLYQTTMACALAVRDAHAAETAEKFPPKEPISSLGTIKIPNTDLQVSRIGYGCADLVPDRTPLTAEATVKADRLIGVAFEHGITLIDTADIYGFGNAELALGAVLKKTPGLRDNVVIQSKCGSSQYGINPWTRDASYIHIVSSVEGSLKRLATDRLDILLLHFPDALVEPEEVAKAFDHLRRSGKVRYFGVSNHTPLQIELLKQTVLEPLVVNQVYLGLGHSNLITENFGSDSTLDYCRIRNIKVQAYSPLRGGFLAATRDAAPAVREAQQLVMQLATSRATTPAVVALAWLLRHPAGIIPIIGATSPEHIMEDCVADKVSLTREEWYSLFAVAEKMRREENV